MNEAQAAQVQPGDVVYFPERHDHFVVGRVQARGIAAPLFWLETIGTQDTSQDPRRCSYRIVEPARPGHPTRAAYRGGWTHSQRTMRQHGELLHPNPAYPDLPDEARLYSSVEVAAELGITQRRVEALAESRHVGQIVGRSLVFRLADIDAMRDRKPGRPARAEAV